jgi:hypothetical protein
VEPVKAILAMPGCSTIACPSRPVAGDDVDHPLRQPGLPADIGESKAVSEVYSAGFRTTVFPAASAGAIFHASIRSGKFHGMI